MSNEDTDIDEADSPTEKAVETDDGPDFEAMPAAGDAGDESGTDAGDVEAAAADEGAEEDPAEFDDVAGGIDANRVRRLLNYVVLGGLVLLAFVAGLQFYLNASASISRWVAPEFRSLFLALFNLAVFLLAAAGVFRQLRRVE